MPERMNMNTSWTVPVMCHISAFSIVPVSMMAPLTLSVTSWATPLTTSVTYPFPCSAIASISSPTLFGTGAMSQRVKGASSSPDNRMLWGLHAHWQSS
eukprot:CAMPEP_0184527608 /NCGR_PEP_ID=MMETSP0198_2-20121128/11315_1 /TAXON_ID=1112570 /ORGANISM="Thraustochytrium sp., Strain LLF1b" /LENGTH=97 /DNA_ID=CAMNT_0026919331 /DNA_START=8 /DNA_END=297 /DNA_ORIENTATION=-